MTYLYRLPKKNKSFLKTGVTRISFGWKVTTIVVLTVISLHFVFYPEHWGVKERQVLPTWNITSSVGCHIPILNPFDPSILHMLKSLGNLRCTRRKPLVVVKGLRQLQIRDDKRAIKLYGKTRCNYKTISRENETVSKISNAVYFSNILNVTSEFLKVQCLNKKKVKFTDYFPFIQRKPEIEARVKKAKSVWNATTNVERFTAILLGLDSVSKNQYWRHMKKTHAYIKDNFVYVDLKRYNKVGVSTFPNMVAFLTGKDEIETKLVGSSVRPADDLPLIWKDFANAGYRTLFSEDIPKISIFNYERKGFEEPPTDYYLRPFSLSVEKFARKKRGCLNHRRETTVILKWTEDFLDEFPKDPLFALNFLTRLSHDHLSELRYQDKPVRDFFERINTKGHLANAIVIFFGDHGLRFGDLRSTYVGRMEDKLPLAFIILPKDFPRKYPQLYRNLKTNEDRLTTPFDMFATLSYILNFTGKTQVPNPDDRCISLMSSEIPISRTCENAAISSHFCACIPWTPVDVNATQVQKGANLIVDSINDLLIEKNATSCATLTLSSVIAARVQPMGIGEHGKKDNSSNFQITVQVEPSKGIFEGSVWYYEDAGSYTVGKTVERINFYGNQSICVNENVLKSFCYCLDR